MRKIKIIGKTILTQVGTGCFSNSPIDWVAELKKAWKDNDARMTTLCESALFAGSYTMSGVQWDNHKAVYDYLIGKDPKLTKRLCHIANTLGVTL